MTDVAEKDLEIAWQPLPGSQTLAISCPHHAILYDGTRGPGKTDAQIMAFRKNVGKGYGRYWRGIIFDREYKNLDDLISKTRRWFPTIAGPKPKFLSSNSDLKWVWETGEELLFRQVKKKEDYWNYHGQEFPFIGWNELCKYPTSDLYDDMMSCNRTSFTSEINTPKNSKGEYMTEDGKPLPPIPLIVFSTTNPYGAGHIWVKRKFVDPAPIGKTITTTAEVYDPRKKERVEISKTQIRLFGSYKENIYLPLEYILELENIKDENKRKAWLYGDWDIVAGGAFDDVWNQAIHVLPRFVVPKTWRIDRSFDWGSTHPFSVGWWAEANGEEATLLDGTKFCPPAGTLIRIAEWYGTNEIGTNKGLKMSSKKIAKGIIQYEKTLKKLGWIQTTPRPGPADNQISNVIDDATDTIAKKMEDQGVLWTQSDKSPGSRINGLELARERLEASLDSEGKGLYFMNNCRATVSILPVLPRDDKKLDDVDTQAEDHIWDEIRYRVLASDGRQAEKINVKHAR